MKLDTRDWQMEYNTSGLRTRRISDDKTYSYIYAGDKLMRMTVGDDILDFSYDANGAPLTMTYNGTVYYYITNLQGDVMKLERADGGSGAQYAYDAWGNILVMSGTLAELNPLRYRGYVYDQETGFYYLNSRYYDPAVGRWLNPDDTANLGVEEVMLSYNLFAYCLNNPVNRFDVDGNWSLSNRAKVAIGAVALAGAIALTVVTGGGAAAIAVGVAKVVGSVAASTAVGAGVGYLQNGKQGAIDGASNGFMFGSLSACGAATLKYLSSPANGIDTYQNLRKINKGTGNQVHHIVEKRFADSLGIDNTNKMLSVALSKSQHQVYTKAWRAALPYGNSYSKMQILGAAVKIYAKSPRLLVSAIKTIM